MADNIDSEAKQSSWKFWKKRRYFVVFMTFLGFFNLYALRVDMSVAIVAMTENRTTSDKDGNEIVEVGYPWDSKQRGVVLSSFFYGYMCTQFLGGFIGSKIGGDIIFGIGVGGSSVATLFTPLAAMKGFEMLLALRIILGFIQGVSFPSVHAIWSRWAPPLERSRMASIAFSGNFAGTIVVLPASGVLAKSWGWPSIFYVFGGLGCVWWIFWIAFVRSTPVKDRFCSTEESEYIQTSIGYSSKAKATYPWKSILTSTAVWAIVISHSAHNWGFYTLITQLPTYLKETLHYELGQSGFLSAIPYFLMGVLLFVSGYFADVFQVKQTLTTRNVRRYFNCLSYVIQAILLIITAYLPDDISPVVMITLAVGINAFSWSGWSVNHLDIAPKIASVLLGFANTFATIPGIVSPWLTGVLVTNKTREEWRYVFFISAGIYIIGAICYWFMCSGERQEWSKDKPEESSA